MEILLAGDVSIRSRTAGSERVRLRGMQQRLVFAMLTLERERGVTREALAEALWPDRLPATWASALRGIVSRLRAFLAPLLAPGVEPLSTRAGRYLLHLPDDVVVDVELAEWAVAVAQEALAAGDAARARRTAEQAHPCLRDSFLAGHEGAWVVGRRAHLTELLIAALEVISGAASILGDGLGALVAANEAVARAPLRESTHRCLMAAHVAAGNRAEALRVYQRLRRTLAEELGVDPAPETEAAYLDLLGPQPSFGSQPSPGPLGSSQDQPDQPAGADEPAPPPGRADELEVLGRAWARASAGERRMVLVTGPSGAGKSRLVAEAARGAATAAGLVLFGRCDRTAATPYQPVVEALDAYVGVMLDGLAVAEPRARADLRRVFPSLSRPAGPRPPSDETLLFEAVTDVVVAATADRPVMIILDDLQHGDDAVFRLLDHLLRRTAAARLLVVAVGRAPALPDHPWACFLRAFSGASWCDDLALAPASGATADRSAAEGRPVTFLFAAADAGNEPWPRNSMAGARPAGTEHVALRRTVELHGGHVFTEGEDGVGAAFDRPSDAIAATITAPRLLGSTRNGSGPPGTAGVPRPVLRIAVHTGEAESRNGRFTGEVVDRLLRLHRTAHVGQVLVSAAAAELVREALPDGAELVEIGTWLVDGSRGQHRVFQLCHPDLPQGFPPPATTRPVPGRLPTYTTTFVDRQADCERIVAALRRSQVITLTGEGGIGKTRLAVETAQRAPLADYPDGVRFCDLSLVPDTDSVVHHVAAAVGTTIPPGGHGRRELTVALQGAQMLLVLDNCDWLRTAAAELLDEIGPTAPGLRVLVTSRAPLGAHGETVFQVQPLGWPRPEPRDDRDLTEAADDPAVQLLVDRALAAGADVARDHPALTEITRRIDDIPLAIELVAPRLATMPAAVLADRLDRLFDVPAGSAVGRAAAPSSSPRQRTLWTTIEWTFGLLSADAQRLLGGLSVFSGGWTPDAAEAVAEPLGLDRDAVAALTAELVELSMIRLVPPASGGDRYTMLATIRAYAADVLDRSGRHDPVADRHAAHFVDLAERAVPHRRGPLEPAWVSQLAVELDNLRAAYRWSLAAGRPGDALRLVAALADDILMREQLEIGRWAEQLAAMPEVADEPLRAAALAVASNTALLEGRIEQAWQLSCEAIEFEKRTGASPAWMSRNTQALVFATAAVEGDWREPLRAMFAISDATGDPLPAAVAHYSHVALPALVGFPQSGRDHAVALVELGSRLGNPTILAMGLLTRGITVADADPDRASRDYHEALELATTAHNTLLVQQALRATEELVARTGDRTTALAALRRIARRFERSGNLVEQVNTILSMLDSIAACGALAPAATICGALANTPWRVAAAYGFIDRKLATTLPSDEYLAARRAGATMSPTELVDYVSALVDELASSP